MGNYYRNKMLSSRNWSNSKLDSKLDSMKFETRSCSATRYILKTCIIPVYFDALLVSIFHNPNDFKLSSYVFAQIIAE